MPVQKNPYKIRRRKMRKSELLESQALSHRGWDQKGGWSIKLNDFIFRKKKKLLYVLCHCERA